MTTLIPANNVIYGTIAGAAATIIQHFLSKYGVSLSPDAANALTLAVAVGMAHCVDVVTGGNIPDAKKT